MSLLEFANVGAAIDGADSRLSNVLIICHSGSALDEGKIPKQLELALGTDAIDTVRFVVSQMKPGKESSASAETYVKVGDQRKRVAIGMLPSKSASRHAAPGHPFSVGNLVKSNKGSGDLSVFLLLADPGKETFAACCAIARVFPVYSNVGKSKDPSKVLIFTCTDDNLSTGVTGVPVKVSELGIVSEAIREAAKLVDMPPNELNVNSYVERVKELIKDVPGVTMTVIRGEELREKGYGGIYGVGQASEEPPALVVLTSNPQNSSEPSVCILGKGIVYDTGGLSIKTKTGMPGMKRDMGGSAGVLGAFLALAKTGGIQQNTPFHCILGIAENSVGSKATRPDDIHKFYSGKTVEINNTDAEGRLVLADALAHAHKHLNPGLLIDMATLTGAQASATGLKHAAIVTNSETLEAFACQVGRASGDLCHPLPYAPEFFRSEFKSSVADMKNSQKNRTNAGCVAPSVFLSNHIEEYLEAEKPWMHIDMAYPSFNGERATGYGVALLFLLLRGLPSKL